MNDRPPSRARARTGLGPPGSASYKAAYREAAAKVLPEMIAEADAEIAVLKRKRRQVYRQARAAGIDIDAMRVAGALKCGLPPPCTACEAKVREYLAILSGSDGDA
ncbi:MAG: hypothetical protein RIB84_22455 [Sneathiellaceae bacterium]